MRLLAAVLVCWVARGCSVEGVVYDSYAGRYLVGARIVLKAAFGGVEWVARTGVDGRFAAGGLGADKYAVHLEKAGYVLDGVGVAELDLHAVCEWKGLIYRMVPAASLGGRLRTREGEPVRRAQVEALERHWTLGGWSFVGTQSAYTDDRGDYRMAVRPGQRYALRFQPGENNPGFEDATGVLWTMIPTLFPGTTVSAEAGIVDTVPLRDYGGFDFAPLMAPVLKIEGLVTSLLGRLPGARCSVMVRRKGEAGTRQQNANYNIATGEFRLEGLSPGDYEVLAYAEESGSVLLASQEVSLHDRDLAAVSLRLEPPFPVHGIVEAAAGIELAEVRLELVPYMEQLMTGRPAAVGADGTFELMSVMRDRSRLRMTAVEPWVYVKSIRAGEEEVRGDMLDWRALPDNGLRVTLAADGGVIEGRVPGASNRARVVVAVPEDGERRTFFLLPSALAGAMNGLFRLANLAPGVYSLYAFEVESNENAGSPLLFGEPGWLEQAPGQGVTVLVVPRGTASAEVPVMRRP